MTTLIPKFEQTGSSVNRAINLKLQETVSVKDFGATGDGSTNDTTAINNALSAVSSTGQAVYFPAGTYIYNGGGSLGNGVVIYGDGKNATKIVSALSSPTSGYLINASGYGSGIEKIAFFDGTTQTGGSYVILSGPESYISEFDIYGDINGILMTGNVSRIRHGRFHNGASGAIRIRAEGGDNSQLIDDVLMGAQVPTITAAGIRVRNSSALIISNTSVITQGIGLLVDPYSNSTGGTDSGSVFSLYVLNCFFDNSGNYGISIAPTGTGSVVRCRFADTWASSASTGVYIVNGGSGTVQGLHFDSCHCLLNSGSGLTTGGTVSDIVINGGEFCQNLFGIYFNNGATHFRVENATIGAGAGLSGNSGIGVVASSSCDYFTITNNDLTGNTGGTISIPATNNRYVNNNLGLTSPDVATGNSNNSGGTTTISHNLGVAPQPYNIIISPNTNWSSTLYVDTTTITTTTFQVKGGTGYFAWQAKIGN